MKREHALRLKTHGFGLSGASVFYVPIIYMVTMLGVSLVMILLEHFFPTLSEYEWLVLLPYGLVILLFGLHILASFYTVLLDPEQIVLLWLGIPLRRIPASQLRLFCAVGNGREDVLCLTSYSVEDLANRREEQLLRNYFSKHEGSFSETRK